MEFIITEQNQAIEIKNGWVETLLNIKYQCSNCLKEFGPLDQDLFDHYTSKGPYDTGVICGKCTEILARPYLGQLKKEKI